MKIRNLVFLLIFSFVSVGCNSLLMDVARTAPAVISGAIAYEILVSETRHENPTKPVEEKEGDI
jgi:hypothetical protein